MKVALPFDYNCSKGAFRLYLMGKDLYEISRNSRLFLRVTRDIATDGIMLHKWNGRQYVQTMKSRTPFDNIKDSTELLTKIIQASI